MDNKQKVEEIKKWIPSARDDIINGTKDMITEHEHNHEGCVMMAMYDYKSIINEYKNFVDKIEEIINTE